MIDMLREVAADGSLVNKTFTGGSGNDKKSYQVKSMDDFSYMDPIDGSVSSRQVLFTVLGSVYTMLFQMRIFSP